MKIALKLLVTILLFTIVACSNDNEPEVKSNEKQITEFTFLSDQNTTLDVDITTTLSEIDKTITATVSSDIDISALVPQVLISEKASVDPTGAQDFTKPVPYIVTAEDGSQQTYTVTFIITSSDKQIIEFTFLSDQNTALDVDIATTLSEIDKTITATVSSDIDISALVPQVLISEKASIDPTGAQDFTKPVSYIVTAEDGSQQTYIVTITVLSNKKQITSFVFTAEQNTTLNQDISATIDENQNTITAAVPFGTTVTNLTPTVEISADATIDVTGAQNFSMPVNYEITAEDESQQVYTVTVQVLENTPPQAFQLIDIANNAINVSLKPSFSWEAAIDQDGDALQYDFFFDQGTEANTVYETNLTNTSVTILQRLQYNQTYAWRVVAKDPNGGETTSETRTFTSADFSFNNRFITNPVYSARSGHASVVFNNKIWTIGGNSISNLVNNDAAYTSNGRSWSFATENAFRDPPMAHNAVVFDGKIWIIGGYQNGTDMINEVWYSTDGKQWIEAPLAPFTVRRGQTSVVFDNKIWMIGGFDGRGSADVWFTPDGTNWTEATNSAPFGSRRLHSSVVFDNKIWVIGGSDEGVTRKNDVWYSQDGINWTQATNAAPFAERAYHTSVVFDNKIWIIGGFDQNNEDRNDVWFSSDGITWTQATSSANFSPRNGHSSVVFDNKVWVIGGNDRSTKFNEVWVFE